MNNRKHGINNKIYIQFYVASLECENFLSAFHYIKRYIIYSLKHLVCLFLLFPSTKMAEDIDCSIHLIAKHVQCCMKLNFSYIEDTKMEQKLTCNIIKSLQDR